MVVPPSLQAAPVPPMLYRELAIGADRKLELLGYWRTINSRKWWILSFVCAAAALAAVLAFALTPVYRSTATVLIEVGKSKVLSVDDTYSENQQRERYQTQVEIIRSREVAERTVRALKLWELAPFDPRNQSPSLIGRLLITTGLRSAPTVGTESELVAATVQKLMSVVVVDPVRLSQLVRISCEISDPKLAAVVANTMAREYIESDRDARFKISQDISAYLQDRTTSLKDKLAQSEQALQRYRETKGIVNLGGSPQTMAGQQVGGTSERLVEARARRLELESAYSQTLERRGSGYADTPAAIRDPAVVELQRKYNDAQRSLSEASESQGANHPRVTQLTADVAKLSALLSQQRAAAVAGLKQEYEAAKANEASLERALGSARGEVQTVNRDEFELAVLEREVTTNRGLYDMFMSRAKETNLASDVQAPVARIVDPAVSSMTPVRPAKSQIIGLTFLFALFAGVVASLARDHFDNTLKNADEAELALGHPLLAAVPEVASSDRTRLARLFIEDPQSPFAESIRTGRTNVILSHYAVAHKTLLVTSALPDEGKTTVAIALALAHAQIGRTLLIDCDMRRSQVGSTLGIDVHAKGLTSLVAGTSGMSDCLVDFKELGLTVLPVGEIPRNPLELLLSQRFKDTLSSLSSMFDMVVIDSPPLEMGSDALVLASLTSNVAVVLRAESTPMPTIRKSLTRLQRAGAATLGLVVNRLDGKQAHKVGYGRNYGMQNFVERRNLFIPNPETSGHPERRRNRAAAPEAISRRLG